MENKELQELFAAKRTSEANRRRQEALRQLLEASDAPAPQPKVRKLWWPVWAGAAAAAVALLLLTLPDLFGNRETAPTLVAETEVPEIVLPQATPEETQEATIPRSPRLPKTSKPSEAAPAAQPLEEVLPEEADPILPEPTIEEPAPCLEEKVLETVTPSPRVMRRQSTLIACTDGCKAPEGASEKSSRNVQINLFNNDNYADATIHTFVISK